MRMDIKNLILICFFLLGFLATSFQIIICRELLVVFSGNEMLLSFVFFWWFSGIGLGACFAGIMPKSHSAMIFIIILTLLSVLPANQIFAIRIIRLALNVPPGELIPLGKSFLWTFIITSPFSFLIGMIFPYAVQVAKESIPFMKDNSLKAGLVYYTESAGSTVAGLTLSLVILKLFPNDPIISIITLLSLASTLVAAVLLLKERMRITASALLILLCAVFIFIKPALDSESMKIRWRGISSLEKISQSDSVYQNIAVGQNSGQYSIFGNGNYISSFPDYYGAEFKVHLLTNFHNDPKDILLLSNGDEQLLKYLLHYRPTSVDMVQIDKKVHEEIVRLLPSDFQSGISDKRVNLLFHDPRTFIKRTKTNAYDLVLSMPGDPLTLNINRFFTKEYFSEVKRVLKDKGIFITSVSSSENYILDDLGRYLGSVYRTAASVFPSVSVIPGAKAYIVCSKQSGEITTDPVVLAKRFEKKKIRSSAFGRMSFFTALQKNRIDAVNSTLKNNLSEYELNTDMHPVTFLLNLKMLSATRKGMSSRLLSFISKIRTYHFLGLILTLCCMGIILMYLFKGRVKSVSFAALTTIFTTGLIGFSSQIVLIYLFQARFGHIYQSIGFLIGIFMFGLTIGALAGNRFPLNIKKNPYSLLLLTEVLILITILTTPFLISAFPTYTLFYALSGSFGFLTGSQFPIANRIYVKKATIFRSAAMIDGLDHLGAAVGALLCGLVLIPALGIVNTCIFLASLKVMSLLFWRIRPNDQEG